VAANKRERERVVASLADERKSLSNIRYGNGISKIFFWDFLSLACVVNANY
jgi:hypothetical protein